MRGIQHMGRFVIAASLLGIVWFVPVQIFAAPVSVTMAGSFQSEVGCSGDWDPACALTHLSYDANDDVWQNLFIYPAGNYEYKAALNDGWAENYGQNATPGGANISLNLPSARSVKFYYDDKTHWVTDNVNSIIATAVGSFQSEMGCSGDWDPTCLRSWLEDPDGNGIYGFSTTVFPAGSYEVKVAIGESWDENYGQGGAPGGANIPFTVPADGTRMDFSYNPINHILTITVGTPAPVPEPTSMLLLGLGLMGLVGVRRKIQK